MPSFKIESKIDRDADSLAKALFTMGGVNDELMPLVKMTVPAEWSKQNITLWPSGNVLFTSVILLFGIIPIDLHRFKLLDTHAIGFKESSSSLTNKEWRHTRTIEENEGGSLVSDEVIFVPKIAITGGFMRPIYHAIFKHRHKRLRAKYGVTS